MRTCERTRETKETKIDLFLNLDGTGKAEIRTGIGFFDHMLTAFAVHSGFDLSLSCHGDLHVDCHHTIEDVGIVLGQAFGELTADKTGLSRYGNFMVPMDEALALCCVDLSGRSYLVFDAEFTADRIGEMDCQMVEEFFRAFACNAAATLHLTLLYGKNDHHKAEALFKAFAHSLRMAVKRENEGVLLSSKGNL